MQVLLGFLTASSSPSRFPLRHHSYSVTFKGVQVLGRLLVFVVVFKEVVAIGKNRSRKR